jgi:hypothetical protein
MEPSVFEAWLQAAGDDDIRAQVYRLRAELADRRAAAATRFLQAKLTAWGPPWADHLARQLRVTECRAQRIGSAVGYSLRVEVERASALHVYARGR